MQNYINLNAKLCDPVVRNMRVFFFFFFRGACKHTHRMCRVQLVRALRTTASHDEQHNEDIVFRIQLSPFTQSTRMWLVLRMNTYIADGFRARVVVIVHNTIKTTAQSTHVVSPFRFHALFRICVSSLN